jgi:hypothetical protein
MEHAPVVGVQHAPGVESQGFGSQAIGYQVPPQNDCRTRVQVIPVQQAPICGQGLGAQEIQLPCQTMGERQSASRVFMQAPVSGSQQAPSCGHGLGEQAGHSACQTRGAEQEACISSVQRPSLGSQQAPGCGQGLGEQVVHSGCQVYAQKARGTTEHAPVVGEQQAPGVGSHGFGSQGISYHVPTHWACSVREQVTPVQQAPICGQGLGQQGVDAPYQTRGAWQLL